MNSLGASRCSIVKMKGAAPKKKKWKPMESADIFTHKDIQKMAAVSLKNKYRGVIYVFYEDGSYEFLADNKKNREEYDLEDE